MRRALVAIAIGAAAGCPASSPTPPAAEVAARIAVAEKGPSGGRLVLVADNGDRAGALTTADGGTVDVNPAWSPDGAHVVFASTRDRGDGGLSLWLVDARAGATPRRLTEGAASDMTPAWAPDGRAVVFASSRGGTLDLWRAPFDGERLGAAERLTDLPGEELSPSLAADGRIVFTRIDGSQARVAMRDAAGEITNVTAGPADSGPSWTPEGDAIVFTAPNLRSEDVVDGDLWTIPATGGPTTLLLDLAATDEAGITWSRDGRWMFVTSVFRSITGDPLWSSVVFVDRWEKTRRARMLVDRAGAVPRVAVAIGPGVLDPSALHGEPDYQEQLKSILRRELRARDPDPAAPTDAATPPP